MKNYVYVKPKHTLQDKKKKYQEHFSFIFFRIMGSNPWQVESILAFTYLNCPECTFKSKDEEFG